MADHGYVPMSRRSLAGRCVRAPAFFHRQYRIWSRLTEASRPGRCLVSLLCTWAYVVNRRHHDG